MVTYLQFNPAARRGSITCSGLALILAFVFLAGCGGNLNPMASGNGSGSSHANEGIGPNNEGSVQLRIGDDPATPEGRIIAMRLDITSMKLWNSSTLLITGCTAAEGSCTYEYTLTSGSAPAVGQTLDITGMANAENNGSFVVAAAGTGTFTVLNGTAITESNSAGSAVTRTAGPGTIDFLVDPVSVEFLHSSTITIPIAQSAANPNTAYDRLDIAYSGSAITYMDMPSMTIINEELGPLPSQTVDLSAAPVTLGIDPVVINVNVNVPSIVTLPPIGGMNVTANRVLRTKSGLQIVNLPPRASLRTTPRTSARPMAIGAGLTGSSLITVSQSQVGSGSQQPQNGQVQNLVGTVTGVVGNSITVKSSGSSLTFQTDFNTRFESITLATAPNATVEVNGSTQANGSLYADEVELVDIANGVELVGMVTYAYPDTDLIMVVQSAVGNGASSSLVGKTVYSQVDSAGYVVHTGDIDMTGVNAVFDGAHFFPGQQVEVESMTGLQPDPWGSSGLTVPFMVELEQQTINGRVANYVAGRSLGTGTFDLVLPQDGTSPLASLNPGLTSVHVYQQSTTFPTLNSINSNAKVQIRGLLMCQSDPLDGGCPNLVMVAAKITVND